MSAASRPYKIRAKRKLGAIQRGLRPRVPRPKGAPTGGTPAPGWALPSTPKLRKKPIRKAR